MELLIGIACITVTIYYLYLMAVLMDIRAERKRLDRLRSLYTDNYDDHIKNMTHLSERGDLQFKNRKRILYIDSSDSLDNIKYNIEYFISKFK